MNKELTEFLESFITDRRRNLIHSRLQNRTRYISVLLEDIFQPHNASAVLRTCDGFGIQDVHIVENKNKFTLHPDIELGAAQWLTIKRYYGNDNNTLTAITGLKRAGYRIVATVPMSTAIPLHSFNVLKGPAIICFGTELNGLTQTVKDLADEFITIPMFGFTESFNISVSVAIVLYQLTYSLRQEKVTWQLSQSEKEELYVQWIKNSLSDPIGLEKEFYQRKSKNLPS